MEKTGKRNLHYSLRHRKYGFEVTMMDFDNVEYDMTTKQPLALIETKFGLVREVDLNDHKLQVMCNLARDLPVFVLVYYPLDKDGRLLDAEVSHDEFAHIQYLVVPVNESAKVMVPKACKFTEIQWVNFLRRLHKQEDTRNKFCEDWKYVRMPVLMEKV